MVVMKMKTPCTQTRYLTEEQVKVQCMGANGHLGAHSIHYGQVGYAWEATGKAQCPVTHYGHGVRCLGNEGHGGQHEGISQHGGEHVKWTRAVAPDPAKPPLRSQGYLDDLQERARLKYVAVPPPLAPEKPLTYEDLRASMEGMYTFDQSVIQRAMLHQPPTEQQLKQWTFEEMITRAITSPPKTMIKLTDGAPKTEPRSYEERKARRNRRNR